MSLKEINGKLDLSQFKTSAFQKTLFRRQTGKALTGRKHL